MPAAHLWHPAVVHYPLALLTAGLGLEAAGRATGRRSLADAASWMLRLGAASAWLALGLGLLAERSAPHVPSAWETMADHETAAYWTAGLFTLLAAWKGWGRAQRWLPLAWALALFPLIRTAYLGGELVFTHAVGVKGPGAEFQGVR